MWTTTIESSSTAVVNSSMEETSKNLAKKYSLSRVTNNLRFEKKNGDKEDDDDDDEEECDVQAWETLSKSFQDVQSVLDQNRVLIKQVNENHQSKVADNLVKNVALIRQINGNISKVMGIYSDLSLNFSNIIQQRRVLSRTSSDTGTGTSTSTGNS